MSRDDPKWTVGEDRALHCLLCGATNAELAATNGSLWMTAAGPRCISSGACLDRQTTRAAPQGQTETPATKSQPFDANPRPLEPAQNGWIFCETCQTPKPVEGHAHQTTEAEAVTDLLKLLAERDADNTRLRALVKKGERAIGCYATDPFCAWCGSKWDELEKYREPHARDCPAFLPDGVVR